jgi:hypothetical protein
MDVAVIYHRHLTPWQRGGEMLYRIDGSEVIEVPPTSAPDEDLYERDVEDWVAARPAVLGEPLLMIGRQVAMDEGKDRIDLLALDTAGSLVVIELKRDLVGGSADLQALRYAALLSQWTHEDVRRQAEGYWRTISHQTSTFAQAVEEFCEEGYEVNGGQRVILAGRDIKPRLGTVALWLRKQGIDTRVVAIRILRDEGRLYVQPQVIIPVPSDERLTARVQIGSSDKPWLSDGQAWHPRAAMLPQGTLGGRSAGRANRPGRAGQRGSKLGSEAVHLLAARFEELDPHAHALERRGNRRRRRRTVQGGCRPAAADGGVPR